MIDQRIKVFIFSFYIIPLFSLAAYGDQSKQDQNNRVKQYEKSFSQDCLPGYPCPRPNLPLDAEPELPREKNGTPQFPSPTPQSAQ